MSGRMTLVAAAAFAAAPWTAKATVYSDRATFLGAIGPSPTIIDFAGLVGTPGYAEYTPNGYASSTGYTLSGVTFTGSSAFFVPYVYIFKPPSGYTLSGRASGMFEQGGGLMTLGRTATTFGFDFGTTSGIGNFSIDVNLVGGSSISTPISFIGGSGPAFFGYTSSGPIVSIAMRDLGRTAQYVKFGDVTFDASGRAGAVPEPASWALLIMGFGLAGAALRQRRLAMP